MISGASDEELDIAIARADVLLELQPKIDELKKENQELKEQLQQKEDIINEAKEHISETKYSDIVGLNSYSIKDFWFIKDLLEILDSKGE